MSKLVRNRSLDIGVNCRTADEYYYMITIIVYYQRWFRDRKPKSYRRYLFKKHKDIRKHIIRLGSDK